MRIFFATLVLLAFTSTTFGQNEPSKKLPPLDQLKKGKPGKVMHFYELPDSTNYSVYDIKGKLVEEGRAEFINFTKKKPGDYFIRFNGSTHKYTKKKKGC